MANQGADSRQVRPENMDEVNTLQKALAPTFRSFFRVTAREPPCVNLWDSYAEQVQVLQESSDQFWTTDSRIGHPPRLAKLSAWADGIAMYHTASFAVSEGAVAGYAHSEAHQLSRPVANNLLHYERTYQEALLRATARELEDGIARAKEQEEAAKNEESSRRQKREDDIETILDSVVARDQEGYLVWLLDFGFSYYRSFTRKLKSLTWEDWCTFFAPTTYEACQGRPVGSISGHNIYTFDMKGSERAQRSSSERPTITLEQAIEGHKERKTP